MVEDYNGHNIAIIGAGVAGMVTALALAARHIPSSIYEKSTHLHEVGAGLQLAPNATKLLLKLGLIDDLMPYLSEPKFINLSNADDGKILLSLPIQKVSHNRWGAKYYTIHRADLQKVLKQKINDSPLISYYAGHKIKSIKGNSENGFQINFEINNKQSVHATKNKSLVKADNVIFCDGVWSNARFDTCGEKSKFSSYIAWRATLNTNELPASFKKRGKLEEISAYMSKDSHFIVYPLRKGNLYNFVVVTKGNNIGNTWSEKADKSELLRLIGQQNTFLQELVKKTPEWTYWPLFQMPFPRFLGPNGEIFLGDASHAVTPFAAQGAAQAIEDACALAEIIEVGLASDDPQKALIKQLVHFDTVRTKRLKSVAGRGEFNRFIYHLTGPLACARNIVMRLRPDTGFLKSLDGLYGYDAITAVKDTYTNH